MYKITKGDLEDLKTYLNSMEIIYSTYQTLKRLDIEGKKQTPEYAKELEFLRMQAEVDRNISSRLFNDEEKILMIYKEINSKNPSFEIDAIKLTASRNKGRLILNRLSNQLIFALSNKEMYSALQTSLNVDIINLVMAILQSDRKVPRDILLETFYNGSFVCEKVEDTLLENGFDFTRPVYLTNSITRQIYPELNDIDVNKILDEAFLGNLKQLVILNDQFFSSSIDLEMLTAFLRANLVLMDVFKVELIKEYISDIIYLIKDDPNRQRIYQQLLVIRDSYAKDKGLIQNNSNNIIL